MCSWLFFFLSALIKAFTSGDRGKSLFAGFRTVTGEEKYERIKPSMKANLIAAVVIKLLQGRYGMEKVKEDKLVPNAAYALYANLESDAIWKKPLCVPAAHWRDFPFCGNEDELRSAYAIEAERNFYNDAGNMGEQIVQTESSSDASTSEDEPESYPGELNPYSVEIEKLKVDISNSDDAAAYHDAQARMAREKSLTAQKKLDVLLKKTEKFFKEFEAGKKLAKARQRNEAATSWMCEVMNKIPDLDKFQNKMADMLALEFPEITLPPTAPNDVAGDSADESDKEKDGDEADESGEQSADSAREKESEDSASEGSKETPAKSVIPKRRAVDRKIQSGFEKVFDCASVGAGPGLEDREALEQALLSAGFLAYVSSDDEAKEPPQKTSKTQKPTF